MLEDDIFLLLFEKQRFMFVFMVNEVSIANDGDVVADEVEEALMPSRYRTFNP